MVIVYVQNDEEEKTSEFFLIVWKEGYELIDFMVSIMLSACARMT